MKLKRPFAKIACLLTGLAFVMILSQTAGRSMAYFTTYTTARGGHPIHYTSTDTYINEHVEGMTKSIVIDNTGSVPCFVRVKVLHGEQFTVEYTDETGGSWRLDDDGYWYYSDIVPVGGSTGALKALVRLPAGLAESFDVIVVQESVPVSYRPDGSPYADWNLQEEAES